MLRLRAYSAGNDTLGTFRFLKIVDRHIGDSSSPIFLNGSRSFSVTEPIDEVLVCIFFLTKRKQHDFY
jgi:hypothetical protein